MPCTTVQSLGSKPQLRIIDFDDQLLYKLVQARRAKLLNTLFSRIWPRLMYLSIPLKSAKQDTLRDVELFGNERLLNFLEIFVAKIGPIGHFLIKFATTHDGCSFMQSKISSGRSYIIKYFWQMHILNKELPYRNGYSSSSCFRNRTTGGGGNSVATMKAKVINLPVLRDLFNRLMVRLLRLIECYISCLILILKVEMRLHEV